MTKLMLVYLLFLSSFSYAVSTHNVVTCGIDYAWETYAKVPIEIGQKIDLSQSSNQHVSFEDGQTKAVLSIYRVLEKDDYVVVEINLSNINVAENSRVVRLLNLKKLSDDLSGSLAYLNLKQEEDKRCNCDIYYRVYFACQM